MKFLGLLTCLLFHYVTFSCHYFKPYWGFNNFVIVLPITLILYTVILIGLYKGPISLHRTLDRITDLSNSCVLPTIACVCVCQSMGSRGHRSLVCATYRLQQSRCSDPWWTPLHNPLGDQNDPGCQNFSTPSDLLIVVVSGHNEL